MKALIKKHQQKSDTATWFLMILYPAFVMVIILLSVL
jgi:hypothetical protein